ncbi:MAG: hypothetical protein K1X72_20455 [Pyrinomonadaceae bacterium]|nr:hypothetical protein [Pyrinomonadaceae bacterium]
MLSKTIILSLLMIAVSFNCFAQKQLIAEKVAKLQQARNELDPKNDNSGFDVQIKDLENDLSANRLFAGLYKLQNLWLGVESFNYNEKKSLVVQDKLPLLEVEWKKMGDELNGKEKQFSSVAINKLPALARAVIEASRHRSKPLYQSSILYGKNTNPNQGLYYMGNAQANIDLALFTQNLRFTAKKTSPKFDSLEKELTQLEREIIEAYRTSTPEEQTRYNAINAALKLAQELNERGWFEGTALKYLDVVSAFGLLKNPSVNSNEIPAMKTKLAEKLTELNKSNFDHSIGITYLEIAQGILANEKVSETDLKRVKVILDTVLPKYENKFLNKGSK